MIMLGLLAFTLITERENLWFFRCTSIGASARAGATNKKVAKAGVAMMAKAKTSRFIWRSSILALGIGKGPVGGDRLPPVAHAAGLVGLAQHAVGAGRRDNISQMVGARPRQLRGGGIMRPAFGGDGIEQSRLLE